MVIIFSNEKARKQLTEKRFVYTLRKNRRKQFINMPEINQRTNSGVRDWFTNKRLGKKLGEVIIHEYGPFLEDYGPYELDNLETFVFGSGFDSLEEWKDAILEFSPGLEKGWIYLVSLLSWPDKSIRSDNLGRVEK